MTELTIWVVSTNTDLTEGRGREYVKHLCRLESTALRLASKGYVQGTDCPVYPNKIIENENTYTVPKIFLKIEEPTQFDVKHEERLIAAKAALQKAKDAGLTAKDIELLSQVKST